MRRVGLLSGGEMSWAAMKLDAKRRGVDGLTLLFTDTKEEDEDTYRYLRESAANIGAPLVEVADGRSIWEVFRDERFIGNTRVDICSRLLKREMAERYLNEHFDPADTTILIGYHWSESDRFRKAQSRWSAKGWTLEAPLCDPPLLGATEICQWAVREGLKRQRLYDLSFKHANCGGFCVKGGHAHFRHLLKMLPERYKRHEDSEEKLRQELGKDVSILRDRRGGQTMPLTLREFRERIEGNGQCDLLDWGGCGCFAGEED